MSDLTSARHTCNNAPFYDLLLGGPPSETVAQRLYVERSAVYRCSGPVAPTLILHGANDSCVPVAQAHELERPALQPMLAPFDGFHETAHAVTGTCLISFDRNRYSVAARAARRAVQVRAYADRIVVRLGDEVIAEHARNFGRDRTIYDPWHYLPILAHKPGALRNGAPFQGWELPPALTRLRRKLGSGDEADRRFVRVLAAISGDGLEAVEAATREALDAGTASDEVILNILARRREPPRPPTITTAEALVLTHPPVADCARYDTLRGSHAAA